MTDQPPPAEPSADAVEAVVRSIEAREAAAADPADPARRGPAPQHPVVVVSAPPRARRPSGDAGPSGPKPTVERRGAGRPYADRPTARPRGGPAPVAGLIGRVEWDRLVADESERQRRYGRVSAIVLVEVAGLGRATALGGPGVVARVGTPCGATLVAAARASDRVTRLRDDRFGILLRETDAAGARRYASRAVAACDPWLAALPWPLHLSAGWASLEAGDDLQATFRKAEARLEVARGRP